MNEYIISALKSCCYSVYTIMSDVIYCTFVSQKTALKVSLVVYLNKEKVFSLEEKRNYFIGSCYFDNEVFDIMLIYEQQYILIRY